MKKIFIDANEVPEEIETSCTHIIVLLQAIDNSDGDVYEFGSGIYSTPILHQYCKEKGRKLITIEKNKGWYERMRNMFESESHKFILGEVSDLDILSCGVVFIDNEIDERRFIAVRFSNLADYVLLHDSQEEWDKFFLYSEIYHYFKYRKEYTIIRPYTTVLSNKRDIAFI